MDINAVILWCVICILCVQGSIRNADTDLIEDECVSYDSCNVNKFFRTCSCSEDCHLYGTCCFDSPQFSDQKSSTDFHCYDVRVPQPVYVKRSCSPQYDVDPVVVDSCINQNHSLSDVVSNVLVSSNLTQITYWNYNCGICNGENATDLIFWTIQASCPIYHGRSRLDIDHVRDNLVYDGTLDQWGILHDKKFLNCGLNFFQPPELTANIRYCRPNLVSSCPGDWKDDIISSKCSSYYGERKSKVNDVYYKNIYCVMCNDASLDDMECSGMNYMPSFNKWDGSTMRIVFILNPWLGEHRRERPRCQSGWIFDPFYHKCRSVECGITPVNSTIQLCPIESSSSVVTVSSWTISLIIIAKVYMLFLFDAS